MLLRIVAFTLISHQFLVYAQYAERPGSPMYFFNVLRMVNADHKIDSVNISCLVKGRNYDLIDEFLDKYAIEDKLQLQAFYFNRFGKVDSFRNNFESQYWDHDSTEKYVEAIRKHRALMMGCYDTNCNLFEMRHVVKDNFQNRHELIHKKFLNKFDEQGRLVEIMTTDSDYCRKITYCNDSIIEEIKDIKYHRDIDFPVVDKIFRSPLGLGYNFFGWADKYYLIKRISIFKSGRLVKVVEESDYYRGKITITEIFYEYNAKGRLVLEEYYNRVGSDRHLFLTKKIAYYKSGRISSIMINTKSWEAVIKCNRSGGLMTEYLVPIYRKDYTTTKITDYKRHGYRIVYRIYRSAAQ